MSLAVCVDANITLKLALPEEDSHIARSLWQSWRQKNVTISSLSNNPVLIIMTTQIIIIIG